VASAESGLQERAIRRSPGERLKLPLVALRHALLVHGRYRFGATRRYAAVLETVRRRRCRKLLEVGVHHGIRAVQMIHAATLSHPAASVVYHGFDLFEELTAEELEAEFSKRPSPEAIVRRRLQRTGARIELYKGYSRETLPAFVAAHRNQPRPLDLVFLDGGHSAATVAEDWRNLEPLIFPGTVVLLDDYYPGEPAELAGIGCNHLVDGLDRRRYRVEILDAEDRFSKEWGVLAIRMVRVSRRESDPHPNGADRR
jgi:predicted O-methyltransferase YrrM